MTSFSCIPFSAEFPVEHRWTKFQLYPGLYLARVSSAQVESLTSAIIHTACPDWLTPTHAILVDHERHIAAAKRCVEEEGHPFPEVHREGGGHPSLIEPTAIAKHVLMTLLLGRGATFCVDAGIGIDLGDRLSLRHPRARGYSVGHRHHVGQLLGYALQTADVRTDLLTDTQLRRLAKRIEPYFRPGRWWIDRISAAMEHLWQGACAAYPTQAYMSFMASIETLLGSTKSQEITHSLALRTAILTRSETDKRLEAYRAFKRLYGLRSQLVHGSARELRGVTTTETLLVSPKLAIVPSLSMKQLLQMNIRLLLVSLSDVALRGILQKKQRDEKTAEQLDEYFLGRLLR